MKQSSSNLLVPCLLGLAFLVMLAAGWAQILETSREIAALSYAGM